jgi:ATP-dependent Lhr-like helicase
MALLERHGVVTREAVVAEGVPGGFAGVYPVLRALEESGKARRGYFIESLGGAQFALPGAVDRLRAERQPSENGPRAEVLAAADPANPYGASLPWPRRPEDVERRSTLPRAAGAYVVLVEGQPVFYLDRGGHGLTTLAPLSQDGFGLAAARALTRLVEQSPRRELTVERVDGVPVLSSSQRTLLESAGFQREYLYLTYRLPLVGEHPASRTADAV